MENELAQLKSAFNLEIISPFQIEISGKTIEFEFLLKDYGAAKGMVIDSNWEKIEPVSDILIELGYGYSCFEITKFSIEDFGTVLDDWGKTN